MKKAPGTELPCGAIAAGLKLIEKKRVICLRGWAKATSSTNKIYVTVTFRVFSIQRLHVEREIGHLGKRTLAGLRGHYIWKTMASDVMRVMKTCAQYWRNVKDSAEKPPLRTLPKG